jgi:hypothetical protein
MLLRHATWNQTSAAMHADGAAVANPLHIRATRKHIAGSCGEPATAA